MQKNGEQHSSVIKDTTDNPGTLTDISEMVQTTVAPYRMDDSFGNTQPSPKEEKSGSNSK